MVNRGTELDFDVVIESLGGGVKLIAVPKGPGGNLVTTEVRFDRQQSLALLRDLASKMGVTEIPR